jgi:type IV secretory pathway VirB2 component (pilin)
MTGLRTRKISSKRWRLSAISFATCMAITERVYGQAKDPWDEAVQVLQTAFTGPIATGLALVAIVVGGLMFAFGEGAAKHARRRNLRCRHGGRGGQLHGVALSVTWLAGGSLKYRQEFPPLVSPSRSEFRLPDSRFQIQRTQKPRPKSGTEASLTTSEKQKSRFRGRSELK